MSVYIGIASGKKEASSVYIGRSGSNKEVSTAYALKNGAVTQVYSNTTPPGQQVFTTSGTFTVPKGIKSIDVFLVGGGGKGGAYRIAGDYNNQEYAGDGGGGGYTKTISNLSVTPKNTYNIIVGASGGNSSFGSTSVSCGACPNGGSGGGLGARIDNTYINSKYAGNGGSDGGNGYSFQMNQVYGSVSGTGGKGQGTTTRAFGESSGTLYAGGGGGGTFTKLGWFGYGGVGGGGNGGMIYDSNAKDGVDGTGGGGGGATNISDWNYRGKGGSGIVIIRWGH